MEMNVSSYSPKFYPYSTPWCVANPWYNYECTRQKSAPELETFFCQTTDLQTKPYPCPYYFKNPELNPLFLGNPEVGLLLPESDYLLSGGVKQVTTPTLLPGHTTTNLMERKRKRSTASPDGFESCDDDDDSHPSALLDPNDPESRRHQRQNHSEIEKRRRDKMNLYITELSALIPMCSAMNRKLDKLTVLRMAVQHMKSVQGSSKMYSEVSHKPSFISDDELKHLILNVADGFLFVVGCDRGRILYVSESVKDILHYSQSDLIGQSLFDILHPRDISKVKEQLSSSDLTPRERFIDAKTMMPVKTELPQKQTHLCPGARRSFFCRMKASGKVSPDMNSQIKVKKEPVETPYQRKRRSECKNFSVIHCTGYLKSWSTAKIGLEDDNESDSDNCSLSCLVAVGRVQNCVNPFPSEDSRHIKVRPMEYMSRHSIDGKFSYIDERATVILGYLPQELLGTSVYEYYHQDDIPAMGEIHRKVLSSKEKLETEVYRFKVKDGKFLHLKSRCFGFRNPWTKEVEYIVSTNSVVQLQEVSSSGQSLETSISIQDDEEFSPMDLMVEGSHTSKGVFIPGVLGGTRPGAGRIGKQIADECMEQINKTPMAPPDSSDILLSPSQAWQSSSKVSATVTTSASGSQDLSASGIAPTTQWNSTCQMTTSHNGINVKITSQDSNEGMSLLENVMQEQTMDSLQHPGNDSNDEAALAFLMSLLEADAGLGGPVDFNDLPWPL